MAPLFGRTFVLRWTERYDLGAPKVEQPVFGSVSARVRSQGFYTKPDLVAVGKWKSSRSASRLQANTDAEIKEITGLALKASDGVGYRLLTVLQGVGVPVASALLTVAHPERYTIIDVRAVRSLKKHAPPPRAARAPASAKGSRTWSRSCDPSLGPAPRCLRRPAGARADGSLGGAVRHPRFQGASAPSRIRTVRSARAATSRSWVTRTIV